MLSAVKDGPRDLAGVLALEEERLGLAVLETENLAVTTDVELALLHVTQSASCSCPISCFFFIVVVAVGGGEGQRFAPCQGRSSGRRNCPRRLSFWRLCRWVNGRLVVV